MEVKMAYENIVFEAKDGIACITFNRPKSLNALNSLLLAEFSQALDSIAADENIRVLVLTGAGEKSFVAGADISELATFNSLKAKAFARRGHDIINKLQERFNLVDAIGKIKFEDQITVFQMARWFDVIADRKAVGEKLGLDTDLLYELFSVIHKFSVKRQTGIVQANNEG